MSRYTNKTQLWIVDNITPLNRFNSEWQLIYPVLQQIYKNVKFKINLICIENNVSKLNFSESVKYQANLNLKLFDSIDSITNRDIVIFTDARTALIHTIYEYFILKGIRPYLVGIWNDGYFNLTSPIRKLYNLKNLSYAPIDYERSISKIYDLNLVTSKSHLSEFKQSGLYKSKLINLPFKFLKDSYRLNGFSELFSTKTDIILYNSADLREDNINMLSRHYQILKDETGFEFFDISTIKTHDLVSNMSLLSRSKLMVSLDGVNISPTAVYHAALMGIVTILPENHLIKSLGYPEALLLNRTEITHNKLYRYMRYMSTVKDKISDVIENHQKYIDDILSVLDTHFEADQFLTLIENIKKIKNNGKRRKHMVGGEIPTKND
jgi:hypothetical protein